MVRIETHVHTKYSKDSLLYFWPLYLKCRLKKINCIAITEHNNIDGGKQFQNFCKKKGNKIHVIVGEEIFTNSGEIIGLYLDNKIQPNQSPEDTISQIKEQNGIVYVPHPYDDKRNKTVLSEDAICNNRDSIDCIEIHNGRNISLSYDTKQKKIADRYGLTPVIGSDAHTFMEIGRNYMVVQSVPFTSQEFRNEIVNASYHEKQCIRVTHTITKVVKILKLLRRGQFNELYGSIVRKVKKDLH